MKYLQVIEDKPYLIWQLYIQMLNFRDYGVEKNAVILVATSNPSREIKDFAKWTAAAIHYFPDTRETKSYVSSIRPHLIKKYMQEVGPLPCFFYHDQDIIFLRKPEIDELSEGSQSYVAEKAENYISPITYVSGFKKGILTKICDIIDIPVEEVIDRDYRKKSGGAQYVIKDTDYAFWDKVEKDCERLYEYFLDITREDEANGIYHIQIWTADMWAVLFNLWLIGDTQQHEAINFSWPWEKKTAAKAILHNAGVGSNNEFTNETGKPLFNKQRYYAHYPFGTELPEVSEEVVQADYMKYIHRLTTQIMQPKKKILGVFNTTNKINPQLLATVLEHIEIAKVMTQWADVEVVTCSWEPIPNNPFTAHITPFRDFGHLNYILQLKQVLANHKADVVVILEHDVIYPANWFDKVMDSYHLFASNYGIFNNNYIGVNETGYVEVKERHQPFSMLAIAYFYLEQLLDKKLNECIRRIDNPDGWQTKYGWCCIEPDDKHNFANIPFTNEWPAIHVNMTHTGDYGTGEQGKNHHFTSHADVCYEADAKGVIYREDWKAFTRYFPL